jgi:MFS family permease
MGSPALPEFLRGQPYGLASTMFFAQVALGTVLFAVFQEYLPNELGTSDAFPGYVIAAYGGARFLGEPLTGLLSDRMNRRNNLLVGLLVMALAFALMAGVDVAWPFLPLSALLGIGTGFLWPASYAMAADMYSEGGRGKAVGVLNVAQLVGFGIGALAGAYLLDQVSATPVFLVALAATAASWAIAYTSLGAPGRRALESRRHAQTDGTRAVLTRPVVSLAVVVALFAIGSSTVIPAIRPYGEEVLDVSFSKLTSGLIPAIAVGAALYIPAGHAADRLGRLPPLLAGLAIAPLGMLGIAAVDEFVPAMVAASLIFAGYVICVPAFNSAMMDLAPLNRRGAVMGIVVAVQGLGLALGPVIGGVISDQVSPATAFRSGAAVMLAALALTSAFAIGGVLSPARLAAGRRRNLEPPIPSAPIPGREPETKSGGRDGEMGLGVAGDEDPVVEAEPNPFQRVE